MSQQANPEAVPPRGRLVRRLILAAFVLGVPGLLWFGWDRMQRRAIRSRGLDLAQSGQFDQAEPLLLKALRSRPNDAEVVEALARGYLQDDHARTEEFLDRWVALRPDDATPLLRRMAFHASRQEYHKALADAERVLHLQPDEETARRSLPNYAFGAGEYHKAEHACRKELRHNPSDRAVRRMLAQTLRSLERHDEAIKVLEVMLSETPNDPAVLVALGHLYSETGQPKRAIPLLRKALDDPRRWGTTRYYLALALKQDGQEEEANQILAQLNKRREADLLVAESGHFPKHVGMKVKAARACLEAGQAARAIDLLKSAIDLDPSLAEAHGLLAELYLKQGRMDLAARHRHLAQKNNSETRP
jgi:tetratricopeptide (TPR) repeat protein